MVTGTHGTSASNPGTVSGDLEINIEGGEIEKLYGSGGVDVSHGKYSSVGSATVNITGGHVGKAVGTVNPDEDRAKYNINYNSDYIKTSDISSFGNVNKTGGKEITTVTLYKLPDKTTYKLGEEFAPDGLTLKVSYLDIDDEYVTSGFELSGFDSSSAGSKRVTVAYEGYTFTFDVEITLHTQEAPSSPVVLAKTDSSVTLRAYDGYEYSLDGVNWRTNNVFTGLLPNTKYSFRQRRAATEIALASPSSAVTEATTDRRVISGSVVITGNAILGNTLTAQAAVAPASATVSYQWYRGGELIEGANGPEYKVDYADCGKKLYVVVTGSDAYTGTLVSSEVEAIHPTDADTPVIKAANATSSAESEIKIELTLSTNPGINTLILSPVLPDGATLVRAENGDIFGNMDYGSTLVFDMGGLSNSTQSGKLATLYVRFEENANIGDYTLGLSVVGCVNSSEQIVNVRTENGVITLTDVIYGDANGDGVITALDIVRLKKYFAEYDPATGLSTVEVGPGADANGDGVITALDIVRLKKYFAEFDPATGTSSVKLGPAD